jgi:hypothetical protein
MIGTFANIHAIAPAHTLFFQQVSAFAWATPLFEGQVPSKGRIEILGESSIDHRDHVDSLDYNHVQTKSLFETYRSVNSIDRKRYCVDCLTSNMLWQVHGYVRKHIAIYDNVSKCVLTL